MVLTSYFPDPQAVGSIHGGASNGLLGTLMDKIAQYQVRLFEDMWMQLLREEAELRDEFIYWMIFGSAGEC
jgi:hypothetical protein